MKKKTAPKGEMKKEMRNMTRQNKTRINLSHYDLNEMTRFVKAVRRATGDKNGTAKSVVFEIRKASSGLYYIAWPVRSIYNYENKDAKKGGFNLLYKEGD